MQRPLRPRDPQAGPRPRADRAREERTQRDGRRLLVGTSYGGGAIPQENVVRASDFLLLHGNGVKDPQRIAEMVRQTRAGARLPADADPVQRGRPLRLRQAARTTSSAAIGEYASWGYFDFRMKGEGFDDGYQSVPVNWGISSPRKKAFFDKLKEITGGK